MKQGLIFQIRIDRAHRIEPEKDKQTGIHRKTHNIQISHFVIYSQKKTKKWCQATFRSVQEKVQTSFRRTKIYRKYWSQLVGEVQFAYANMTCNLKVKFRNNEESFFTSMQELEDILEKQVSLLTDWLHLLYLRLF